MTSRPFAAFLLLASAGVACLVYAGADFIAHEWAVKNLWPLLAAGFAVVPIVAFVAWGRRWWEREGVALETKRQDNKRAAVQTAEREWGLRVAQREAAVASGLAGAREAEALERRWQVGAEILFRAIDKAGGASGRKLSGVVGSDTHPALMAFYTSPAGLCILRDAGGNVGHTWGFKDDGGVWCLDDVLALNRAGKLPHPDGEPPEINPLPPSAAQRNTPRKGATQKNTVIDGTAREVGQ